MEGCELYVKQNRRPPGGPGDGNDGGNDGRGRRDLFGRRITVRRLLLDTTLRLLGHHTPSGCLQSRSYRRDAKHAVLPNSVATTRTLFSGKCSCFTQQLCDY